MPSGSVSLLLGTTKGVFILRGGTERRDWSVDGPFCTPWSINHVIADDTGTIWAGGGTPWVGAGVWKSENDGATWMVTRLSKGDMDDWAAKDPDFAKEIDWTPDPLPFDGKIVQVWSLCSAHGRIYAGVKPASLLRSDDQGATFSALDNLSNHPSAQEWVPGGAGMILHTIVPDPAKPAKLWVGISAAGVFATEDDGQNWERRNRLSNVGAGQGPDAPMVHDNVDVGHCVHNMVRAAGPQDLLYQQNHHGVWRSTDGGRSWDGINAGLPSTFGFPIWVHPHDPDTIWVVPLNGDSEGRYPPDGDAAVWRSRDGGQSWQDLREGLPQKTCFFTVLRQAMCGDTQKRPGVYFGTNSGSIFASFDEGDSWAEIARHLPTILSVEVMEQPG